jgi:hypothetical protein
MKKQTTVPRRCSRLFALLTGAALLGTAAPAFAAELLVGVADETKLVLFLSDDPDDVKVVKIKGLQRREEILGLDKRPLTGELYALGSSARLYTIDHLTGRATAIGLAPFTNELVGTKFGFDFNPTVDRIRIVSNAGLNIRVNPTNGLLAAIDGNLAYATNDTNAGVLPRVVAAAYINNDTNPATGTVLYDIDSSLDVLAIQNPPNSGTLVTVGPLGYDVKKTVGFDVAGSDGTAYASLVVKKNKKDDDGDDHDKKFRGSSDRAHLFTIDLLTGAATHVGKIGGPKPLTALTSLGAVE